jgi:RNA polymerase sigma factor (sigma-70 family)
MTDRDDHQLLAEFARENSEAAFAALVERHVNLVFSTALRSVGNAHAAEEISQAVFIILAQKAGKLSSQVVLSGWLYQTTRLTAANYLRGEIRRQQREQEAYMQSFLNEPVPDVWPQIAPLLDDALGRLGETDRNAIVLRFFENKSLAEVGLKLGASEDAAKMRVNRALEKLRKIFSKRGVTLSAALIAGAVSANSLQAAPVGLAKTIAAVALTKGAAAGGSTLALVKGALKIMAWTKAKMAVVVGVSVLLAAGTATVAVEKIAHPKLSATDLSWLDDPKYWKLDSRVLNQLPSVLVLRPTKFSQGGGSISTGKRALGVKVAPEDLLANAYGFNTARMVFNTELPEGNFDFVMTPPYEPWKPLQGEIKKQLGLTARPEMREVDVLQLRCKLANHPGIKPGDAGNTGMSSGMGELKIQNLEMGLLADALQGNFRIPITDHTQVRGRHNLTLKWAWNGKLGETEERSRIRQALLDQLGLELVPARESIEMLVVEKVK